eukprot:1803773-Alexandrium_andersonii.AAC.1
MVAAALAGGAGDSSWQSRLQQFLLGLEWSSREGEAGIPLVLLLVAFEVQTGARVFRGPLE